MQRSGDVLVLVGAVLAGALTGFVGSFLQAATLYGLPAGLAVALGLSAVAVLVSGRVAGSAAGSALALLGWLATVLWVSVPRPEGDVVVAAGRFGYGWLYGGTVVLLAVVVLDLRRVGGPAGRRYPRRGERPPPRRR